VTYSVTGQWPGGFQAAVHVVNNGSTAVNGWNLTWSFANGQVITQLWSGTVSQSGAAVTVTNASYNGTLNANGGSADFGFLANWTSANAAPTSFKLNGTTCS
jgi:endo-1,4-beta-xylanase